MKVWVTTFNYLYDGTTTQICTEDRPKEIDFFELLTLELKDRGINDELVSISPKTKLEFDEMQYEFRTVDNNYKIKVDSILLDVQRLRR